ncbi:MAG: tyrosine-type recombinase/integrase [Acidobacteriaceae bacterium]
MTLIRSSIPANDVNSTTAISAPHKEKLRMKAQRYQRGSLSLRKRKSLPDVWEFRHYEEVGNKTAYKKQIVGDVIQFPKRKDAEKAVAQLRVDINQGAEHAPMNVEQLAVHYQEIELPSKAYSTQEGYKNYLKLHVLPKWGQHSLSAIKAVEVETWLRGLKTARGKAASPGTKTKVRNLMSALFSHAIRYEWSSRNPISSVRSSAKRLRTPDILTTEEFQALIPELSQRARVIVLLAGSTGLRRGEMIALRWRDIDFESCQADVQHSIWRNVEGDTKTEVSRKPVPLPPFVVEELKQWREASLYKSEDDFVFPSVQKNGKQAISPDSILKREIRPALQRIGVTKQVGFHTFRHSLATLLGELEVNIKTTQELLRHANPNITMRIYQQAVSKQKRAAQKLAFGAMFSDGLQSNPPTPNSGA